MKNSLLLTTASLLLCVTLPNAANARPMTETDLASMKRLASPSASPDGKMVWYQVRETDLPPNQNHEVIPERIK